MSWFLKLKNVVCVWLNLPQQEQYRVSSKKEGTIKSSSSWFAEY